MKNFRVKTYEIRSKKIKRGAAVSFAVLSDLHGIVYGDENRRLSDSIRARRPDAVLVVGDMLVRTEPASMEPAKTLLKRLAAEYPVYYSLGNHEAKMLLSEEYRAGYEAYQSELEKCGVRFLHNQKENRKIKGTEFIFHGLEIPMEYYRKPRSPRLQPETLRSLIGVPEEKGFHVLLAHNPKYGSTYFSWGADLILSGHYHGGVVRFTENHGLTSPQYLFFPPYCCGCFHKDNAYMAVSAGLGEHTIPVRIHNPRELLFVRITWTGQERPYQRRG